LLCCCTRSAVLLCRGRESKPALLGVILLTLWHDCHLR